MLLPSLASELPLLANAANPFADRRLTSSRLLTTLKASLLDAPALRRYADNRMQASSLGMFVSRA